MVKTPQIIAKELNAACNQLVIDLGLKSFNDLWTKAGVNRDEWAARVDMDDAQPKKTTIKNIDSLIERLRERNFNVSYEHHKQLYQALGAQVEPLNILHPKQAWEQEIPTLRMTNLQTLHQP
jgi:hypothetical protein